MDAPAARGSQPSGQPPPGDARPLAGVVRAPIRRHGRRLRRYTRALRRDADAETIHDLRVVIRSIRALMRELMVVIPARRRWLRRYDRRLRWLARQLGAVRDLDVLLDSVDAYREAHPTCQRQLIAFRAEVVGRRHRAREHLARALRANRCKRVLRDTRRLSGHTTPLARAMDDMLARDFAGFALWHAYGELLACSAMLPAASVEPWHQTRIACRRLRYLLEMLAWPPDPATERVIGLLLACQQSLGALHDCAARLTVAGEIARRTGTTSEIAGYLDEQQAELERLLREAPAHWETLRDPEVTRLLADIIATR